MVTTHEYYLKNKEKILKKNAEWTANNLEYKRKLGRDHYYKSKEENRFKYLLKYAKSRSIKKNLEFSLTEEWLRQAIPDICPIMGVKLDWNNFRFSPSIDRIDSNKGYIEDNCWIISTIANKMKQDSTKKELELFSKGILRLLEKGELP